ncbi:MAG: putative colanic acid biosynthesis acetyltransferase [Dysgonamonadaceae bacterium]|jgi:putative colanic acid biosynthesis acetyltransferase WcaF|nr:putative colanic acid biosynthesis acetyltransferase [Dysgonamonadaceae bacterium]
MELLEINLSQYQNKLSKKNQIARFIWTIAWTLFARPLPRSLLSGWKRFLLRCFGAKIHKTACVYSSAKVFMPWKLEMDEYACLSSDVDCYNVEKIKIGKHATISQRAFLCTASHDIGKPDMPLITVPITIENYAWVAADAFVGMGVTIGEGAVVGARAAVFKDVEPWSVMAGSPAKFIKKRIIKQ